MDETPPAAEFDASEAAEARPVLEYGTPESGDLAAIVRGVGLLLLVVGGIGFLVEVWNIIRWLISPGGFDTVFSYLKLPLVAMIIDAGAYLLLATGGLLCRRYHPAAANLICVGAAAMLLSNVLVWSTFYAFAAFGGSGISGKGLGYLFDLALQTARQLPTALLPLLLLYLFTRPLIRGAIGVK